MSDAFYKFPDTRVIDEEISYHEQRVLELKARRNAYARISIVPEDVLLEIFKFCREAEDPVFVESWHQLAHVCHHWRCVALDAPLLWTMPPTHLHNYTIEMLNRSKTANLHIIIDKYFSFLNMAPVMESIARIQTFDISMSFYNSNDVLKALHGVIASGLKASTLENLTVHVDEIGMARHTLSHALFHKPNVLGRLNLSNMRFDWKMLSSSPNLTHLYLADHMTAKKDTAAETILTALGQAPGLETLSLCCLNVLLPTHTEPIYPHAIQLSRLQCLTLTDSDLAKTRFLLSGLSLPCLRQLNLECDRANADDDDDANFSTTMKVVLATLSNGNFEMSNFVFHEKTIESNENFSITIPTVTPSLIAQFLNGVNSQA